MPDQLTSWMQSMLRTEPAPACGIAGWTPAADVYRTSDGWLIKVDVAGVHPRDVRVNVEGHRMTVSGTRRDQVREQGMSYYHMEISYSTFQRTIELPVDLQQCEVSTRMCDGMLLIRIH